MRALLALATIVLLSAAGCGSGGAEEATPPADTTPAAETPAEQAPDIEGVTLEGETLSLADFRGRPLFVNVWSSW